MAERINTNFDPSGKFVRGASDHEGILEQLEKRVNEKTPDYIQRKLEGYIPVFVYGSLRQGFHNHGLLNDLPFLGKAHTTIEKYEMQDTGSFPVVYERAVKMKGKKHNPVVGKIHGEVYVVDPKTLLQLDRLESNGRMYTRSLQWIFLSDQTFPEKQRSHLSPSLKCWMYLGNEEFWRGVQNIVSCKSSVRNGVRFYDWASTYESSWSDEDAAWANYVRQ